ncbi:hypothetical protein PVAND_009425 [Polypedilum vanderplanki]|uniref:Uncharacterized protein n=1 Tax=Polypedilum vanderplanki TaxID=319348 RepID=A0A9J6CDH4_POLVA|nr:hypothetical protein PVAND_009425 [Polypedilum vanderplanki]
MTKTDSRDKHNIDDDLSNESVEELRNRLNAMKRLVAERQNQTNTTPDSNEFWTSTKQTSSIIDGNFLSLAFGGTLLTIICVSIYAFYNLYNAVLKKFPSRHTEL